MEGIRAIAIKDFGPDRNELQDKRLILISDLLQNGSGFSAYQSLPSMDQFLRSEAGRALGADLTGTKVWIYLLNRNSPKQTGALLQFWFDWLGAEGADFQEERRIPG
jgi:hypothetical protein